MGRGKGGVGLGVSYEFPATELVRCMDLSCIYLLTILSAFGFRDLMYGAITIICTV